MRSTRWLLIVGVLLMGVLAACAPAPAAQTPVANDTAALPALISPQDAESRLEAGTAVLVDVRTQQEWSNDGRAADATLIPLDQLEARAESELNKDDTIMVVCRSGNRSQTGAQMLRDMGFTNVTEVEGGMRNWVAQGLEIECDMALCGLQ